MQHISEENSIQLREELISKIKELGADIAGTVSCALLKDGPSEKLFPNMKDHTRDHFADEITTGLPHGKVFWENDAKTAIIYGVAHPADRPEMDWWCGEIDPPGNKKLLAISKAFIRYMKEHYPEISVYGRRYHVERGGLYLKDAAVMAGLGCIGRNNLLVTPEFGPRVRLRAVVLSADLPSDGPIAFDPCRGCDEPCRTHCPQKAFEQQIYTPEENGERRLPGRDGTYFRASCNEQMLFNEEHAKEGMMPEVCDHPEKIIKYCRNCELFCKVGI